MKILNFVNSRITDFYEAHPVLYVVGLTAFVFGLYALIWNAVG